MKKKFTKFLGVVLSTAMVMTPMMEAMAAANKYDVNAEDVAGKVLFPGDSISGIEPIYMGPDGTALEVVEGKWTNDTAQAYSMSAIESEEGGLWLEPKGYVLTVNDGTSKVTGTDGTDTSNHFKAKEETEEDKLFPKDVAYYNAWTDVTVIADQAPEGQVFDHWEVEGTNVTLTDAYAAETTFTMIEDEVVLSAVYVEAAVETEAPTEAPAEVPVETEAPVVDEPVVEEPTVEDVPADNNSGEVIVIGEDTGIEVTADNGTQEETSAPTLYNLTVENGAGDGDYEVGTTVTVTADQLEGMVFSGWYTEAVSVWFADSTSAETTFSMPAENVVIAATYTQAETSAPETTVTETELVVIDGVDTGAEEETAVTEEIVPDLYTVEVEFGEGGGSYEAGAQVIVYADGAADDQEFAGWITSENLVLENPASEEAIFTMPAENVKLTATYKTVETETEAATEYESGEIAIIDQAELETEAVADNAAEEVVTEAEELVEDVEVVETETEAVEDQAATEAAVKYEVQLSDGVQILNALSVDSVSGLLMAEEGTVISAKATEYEDYVLSSWTVTRTDTGETVNVSLNDEDMYLATFEMPASNVYVEVKYVQLANNEVQIVNGSGSGNYSEGDYVEIVADDPEDGYRFKGWTVITGNVTLDDYTAETTEFVMPATAVQIKATYEVIKYTLTVENGSGDGSYVKGETVSLTADYPAEGKVFAGWTVTSEKGSVASADRYYSSITMPAANVTVKATYKDGPSPDYNEIQNIVSGGEYLKGTTISFTAVGNGMGNTNPNPGDYRYRPSGYQIGSVTGNWSNSPYTTSMAINAVGQYTLYVTYTKDIYDGSSWVSTGTTDTKSVTFYVVNALSVQTGDSSPIIPLAIAAVAALVVIVVLLVVRRRRRY